MRQLGDRSGALGADQGGLVAWYGVFAPANTPHEIFNRLSAEFVSGAKSPDVVAKYEAQGPRVTALNQEQFGAAMKADMVKWDKVVKATGFTTQN